MEEKSGYYGTLDMYLFAKDCTSCHAQMVKFGDIRTVASSREFTVKSDSQNESYFYSSGNAFSMWHWQQTLHVLWLHPIYRGRCHQIDNRESELELPQLVLNDWQGLKRLQKPHKCPPNLPILLEISHISSPFTVLMMLWTKLHEKLHAWMHQCNGLRLAKYNWIASVIFDKYLLN